jgi:hypothetical protein
MMNVSKRIVIGAVALAALLPLTAAAQRGFGFGGPMQQERKVLAQFDKDGNKRLDTTERRRIRRTTGRAVWWRESCRTRTPALTGRCQGVSNRRGL